MSQISGSLVSRNYGGFKGVDFSSRKDEISLYRSPDALNMWKNYKNSSGKCIETRPDIELLEEHSDTIFGLFFYTKNGVLHKIVHSGPFLLDNGKKLVLESKEDNMSSMSDSFMNMHKSNFFVYENNLYILDGEGYYVYDGNEIKIVEGYIPTTSISRNPSGGGTIHEDVNLLNGYRKNSFVSDGKATEYFLDVPNFDKDSTVKAWVNDKEVTDFTVDYTTGKITFKTAPGEPLTVGQDNVVIQFKKTVEGYRNRIAGCTLVEIFDNRVFFSGNPDYPNMLWHSSLNDPTYCSDLDNYPEGTNDSKIKSIIAGNNALWVLKEPSQHNTTIFYHNPTIDSEYGKVYPSTHSSISTGCVTKGINFKDAICFFSDRGMEAITGDVTTEQVVSHKSTLVDARLLNEEKYNDMMLEEWEGYLLVVVGNKIYLADSREQVQINDHIEYEWFYWEFDKEITSTLVKDGVLYLCSDKKVYTLTKTNGSLQSYWTTLNDEFKYPQYQKITNKKGCVADVEGNISIMAKTDNGNFELIDNYVNVKGYIVPRIKKKKWKAIQLKFYSTKPFSIYSCTLESYIGSYIKR